MRASLKEIFFSILPSEKAKTKTLEFGRVSGYPITNDDCYVAPNYQRSAVRGQRSDLVGQAFLPAEPMNAGKRERLPYTSSLKISAPAALDYQVRNQDSAIADKLIKRQLFDGLP